MISTENGVEVIVLIAGRQIGARLDEWQKSTRIEDGIGITLTFSRAVVGSDKSICNAINGA